MAKAESRTKHRVFNDKIVRQPRKVRFSTVPEPKVVKVALVTAKQEPVSLVKHTKDKPTYTECPKCHIKVTTTGMANHSCWSSK